MSNMNDVARHAGVSRGTVSNYLNNKKINEESAKKIEKAILELNYVPNTVARDFRTQKSKFIVFIIPTVWSPFFSELTYYVQSELNKKNYKMILCLSNSNFSEEKDYVKMAEMQKVAGIITISYSDLSKHVQLNTNLVSIEKESTGLFPLVSSDNYMGGRLAVEEFNKRGCSKLVYVDGEGDTSSAMRARRSGFLDECQIKNVSNSLITLPKEYSLDMLKIELKKILLPNIEDERLRSKKGIFALTDEYAMECYQVVKELGLEVPKDVQIIGFDGSKIRKNESNFISSIRQPVPDLAHYAVEILDNKINGIVENDIPRIYLPVKFQQGKTTEIRVNN